MRYGFVDPMHKVAEGLLAATQVFDLDRLPEVFGGHNRDARHPHPGLYPGACSPQAWSAGAVILLVMTMIGLTPLAPRGTLVVDPALPDWLPEITVRNIQVGKARVSLRLRRNSTGHTDVEVMDGGGLYAVRPAAAMKPGVDRCAVALAAALHPVQRVRLSGQAPATCSSFVIPSEMSMTKIVVVTGAGAGVGRATVEEFAKHGYDVALLSRDPDRLAKAADALRRHGVRALAIPTDVADADAVEAAAEQVENELGPIDVWVNVAMATVFAPVHKLSAKEVERGTQVTYLVRSTE